MGDSPPEAAAEVFELPQKSMLPHAKELVFNPQAGRGEKVVFFSCMILGPWFLLDLCFEKKVLKTWFLLKILVLEKQQ